ncbi:hypothetical protein H8Z59_27975 [Mycolicibacterium fortuitum]|uniref:hypothetical protein n=1 Tax=Mycolicibacterium fortuitum TaxID=1766 RepID=UPI001CDB9AC8|nr:hypothetical protein [Mycolicibacterium fortuitum]UBV20988.1 hypothetical protein H8Z59_27975 [Mycolicibacterium fortuitum]
MARSFLRVRGELSADGTYHPLPGWETQRLVRAACGDPDLTLRTYSTSGDVLARGPIQRRQRLCVGSELRSTDCQRLVGHVVCHPETAKIVVSQDCQPIFTAEVAAQPPQIHRLTARFDDGRLLVEWAAEHSEPLTFNLLYVDPLRRVIPVAEGLQDARYQIDATDLPGGGDAAVGLVATDGIRSIAARSGPFPMQNRSVELCMIAPGVSAAVRQGHPFSLIGLARDLAGRTLPEAGISWFVDDENVANDTALACTELGASGEHTVTMIYRMDGCPAVRVQRSVTVTSVVSDDHSAA